ncbi:hypothetical protein NUW58_g1199 [Xylaria curta]|uniref:Uncharacterized protein n=1 Tax=Xylaria curta TaxID=42375 RepID=A0ACC1PP90_9PEZI|nr:hypothetical protein NUW58_g1199 [Xylaria curta]
MARGARYFVFVGRSGCDKPEARGLVERLHGTGATVTVVRGDVSNAADVDTAVETCVATGRSIGGVVQAAMGLHEALFCTMPNSAWQTGIRPKWQGSWNLHKSLSLEGRDTQLDFFLLTSSVSGSVGTATESNYCAANAFLDAFAYWRRSQGKPAVSVGFGMISEVGYLHENLEIEALLLRKGIQALNEDEFLQVVDMALTPATNERPAYGPATSHILTGLEPFGLRELIKRGFDVENGTTQDPRCAFLAAALAADQRENGKSTTASNAVAAASWYKVVPTGATGALAAEADAPTLFEAVLRLVRKRFSSLILMPLDQIDDRRPLTQFGIDSMIAAEFRTWFWSAFKVDIPFLDIMSPKKALDTLSAYVEEKLIAQPKVVPSE